MKLKNYPEKWKTQKNLEWWLSQQDGEFIAAPTDRYVHCVTVAKFAKQYHAPEIEELERQNKILKDALSFYADEGNYTKLIDYKGLHYVTAIGSPLTDQGKTAREALARCEEKE